MEKISLVTIVGPGRKKELEHMLSTIGMLADEWVLCHAVGASKPTDTSHVELLAEARKKTLKIVQYKNGDDACEWPHCDDFAAARNTAQDAASHEWCLTCDTDDVCEQSDFLLIKETVDSIDFEKIDVIEMPYEVKNDNATIMRPRYYRRSVMHWKNAIHEALMPRDPSCPVRQVKLPDVAFQHYGAARTKASDERNLRIINRVLERGKKTAILLFYKMQAHIGLEQWAEVKKTAAEALEMPDIGRDEEVECLMQLAFVTSDPAEKKRLYTQAWLADPRRREALHELAMQMVRHDKQSALQLMEVSECLPEPEDMQPRPWNLRNHIYGHAGAEQRQIVLRTAGRVARADAELLDRICRHRAAGHETIALLHFTRGAAAGALEQRRKWLSLARHPGRVLHLFAAETGDTDCCELVRALGGVIVGLGEDRVGAINALARLAIFNYTADTVLVVNDTLHCERDWDLKFSQNKKDHFFEKMIWGYSHEIRLGKTSGVQNCLLHPAFFDENADYFYGLKYKNKIGDSEQAKPNRLHEKYYAEYILGKVQRGQLTHAEVPGWCNYRDLYFKIAQKAPDGVEFLEIGCWLGRSVIFLAECLKSFGKGKVKLHVIDTFRGDVGHANPLYDGTVAQSGGSVRKQFEENIARAGVADMIVIHEGSSTELHSTLPDKKFHGIFVDGGHEYDEVIADVRNYLPKLVPGGVMAGHDWVYEPVQRAVREALAETGRLKPHLVSNTSWVALPVKNEEAKI